jgi:site-specific DNA-methyltransferase (adenine-specific)
MIRPTLARYRIEHGDCLDLLKREPANSWDAMVTDPPGGISFMSRAWDGDKGGRKQWVRFMSKRFKAALRVLKPGAHALVWALPRTSHWTGCALEDAGFEVRDGLSHAFGSGFPKSHNLPGGLGTALKPSHELWFLVRKPLEKGLTVEQNHAKWGTGVLNIDACRVGIASVDLADMVGRSGASTANNVYGAGVGHDVTWSPDSSGRWPPNLLLTHDARCHCIGTRAVKANPTWDTPNRDTAPSAFTGGEVSPVKHGDGAEDVPAWECVEGCPVLLLDRQSGERTSGSGAKAVSGATNWGRESERRDVGALWSGDSGTASRFFPQFQWDPELDDLEPFIYAAKASRGERDKGLEHFKGAAAQRDTPNPGGIDAGSRNVHPTVKSVELIRYFVRLVTPRGGEVRPKVGDIFMGSGTGGVAALLEGCDFVGFEREDTDEEPFVSIARARCEHVVGGHFVPRASLRTDSPPPQRGLFDTRETA